MHRFESWSEELFRLYLKDRPICAKLNYSKVAEETEGYSSADIENAVNDAARIAVKTNALIGMGHIFQALERNPASLKEGDVEKINYLNSNNQ